MGPGHGVLRSIARRRLDQQAAAEFLISLGREPRQDEMPAVVEEQHAVADWLEMSVAEPAARRLARVPDLLAGGRVQTAKTAVAFDAVAVTVVLEHGGRNRGRGARPRLPEHRGGRLPGVELKH